MGSAIAFICASGQIAERTVGVNPCVVMILITFCLFAMTYHIVLNTVTWVFESISYESSQSSNSSCTSGLIRDAQASHFGGFRSRADAAGFIGLSGLCALGRLRAGPTTLLLLMLLVVKGQGQAVPVPQPRDAHDWVKNILGFGAQDGVWSQGTGSSQRGVNEGLYGRDAMTTDCDFFDANMCNALTVPPTAECCMRVFDDLSETNCTGVDAPGFCNLTASVYCPLRQLACLTNSHGTIAGGLRVQCEVGGPLV